MLLDEPQFLSKERLTGFKRDECIFCSTKFESQAEEYISEVTRKGEYVDHIDRVLFKSYEINDSNFYSFVFEFPEQIEKELRQKKEEFVEMMENRTREEAEKLKQELEKKFKPLHLLKEEKDTAVLALVQKCLYRLGKPPRLDGIRDDSQLERETEQLFHNLQLGDLQLVWRDSHYCYTLEEAGLSQDEIRKWEFPHCVHISYSPEGLKSHKNCWPFKDFYGRVSFTSRFEELFNSIKRNPQFGLYEELFRDFQELWEGILAKKILIKAKAHNFIGGFI